MFEFRFGFGSGAFWVRFHNIIILCKSLGLSEQLWRTSLTFGGANNPPVFEHEDAILMQRIFKNREVGEHLRRYSAFDPPPNKCGFRTYSSLRGEHRSPNIILIILLWEPRKWLWVVIRGGLFLWWHRSAPLAPRDRWEDKPRISVNKKSQNAKKHVSKCSQNLNRFSM